MFQRWSCLLLGFIAINCFVLSSGRDSSSKCPQRTESDARCRKECVSDDDCLNRKRNKKCICDGPCGLSCVRIKQKCFEDRSLVTRLNKGKVFINDQKYRKKTFNVGDVVSYKCRRGFQLTGPANVTCSGIGKWKPWDQGTTACRRQCPDPGNPKDGRRMKLSQNDFEVGSKVRFICNPGYTRKGSPQVECLSSLKWSSTRPRCEVSSCPKLVLPENSVIVRGEKSTYAYGDRIFINCEDGYFRMGTSVMYCGILGWQTPTRRPSQCLPKSCGNPGYISNGKFEGRLYTFGKRVRYSCDLGYKLRGQAIRRCLMNERWSGSRPLCNKVNCGSIGNIENGRVKVFETKYLDKAYVECLPGFHSSGSSEVICTANGKWSKVPSCTGVVCNKSFVSIENGVALGLNVGSQCINSYNCKVTFTCNAGFVLDHGKRTETAICLQNGEWSVPKPQCKRISCGRPLLPLYGKVKQLSNGYFYESVIEYECNDRYNFIGVSQKTCLATGRWSGGIQYCKANCGPPGVLKDGNIDRDPADDGNVIRFRCNEGFQLIGSKSSRCYRRTARWYPSKPTCERILCSEGQSLGYGKVIPMNSSFEYLSVLKYQCNPSYKLVGHEYRKCLANGEWEGSAPTCRASCGDPGRPLNGYKDGDKFMATDKVKYSCKDSYQLVGAKEITCRQYNAKWSRSIPTCQRRCDLALGMADGRISDDQISMTNSVYGHDYKPRLHNDTIWCGKFVNGEVSVKIRFTSVFKIAAVYFQRQNQDAAFKGLFRYFDAQRKQLIFRWQEYSLDPNRDLGKYLELESPIYTSFFEIGFFGRSGEKVCENIEVYGCEAIATCKIPKAPVNGETLGHLYREGSKAIYSCFHGYKLESDEKQICQGNGTWSGTTPRCIKDPLQGECYLDFPYPRRTLPELLQGVNSLNCWGICKRRGFSYAGMQYGKQCFCGNEREEKFVAPASDCYLPCAYNPSQKCGGPWRNSLYKKTGV